MYLICDQQDEAAVEPLEDFFYARGVEVSLPGFEADESEVQQIHIQNLKDCDAALIYYGAAGMHWVDFKIRDLQKAAGYRDSRPIPKNAVYVCLLFNHRKERFKSVSVDVVRQSGDSSTRPCSISFVKSLLQAKDAQIMSQSANPPVTPFPGLRPFRSDEHHLFFGREEQTRSAFRNSYETNRFLAVVGTSGSGKSSLVRAGMIAELHGGTMTQAGSTREVMILRPGGNPVENLARAFVDADFYDAQDPSTLPRLLATLNRSRFGLVEAMKQCDLFEPGMNLLVVVDQFEELFRFRQQGVDSEESAAAFVNLLLTASGRRKVRST